jgi:hypothetical protein
MRSKILMTEARLHPRHAIELEVSLHTPDDVVDGRTRDLSRGGLCVRAETSLPVGTECLVRLALVFSENQFSEHLELPATVMWSTRLGSLHQIGVKFGALAEETRGYLDLFMKFLEGEDDDDDGDEGETE